MIHRIRVYIVDDSLVFRKILETRLAEDRFIEIVGTAVDAIDALQQIDTLKPDVITLDVEMPKMNGIEFLKALMPVNPLPVVVVSSAPITTLDALSAGAVDFVKKPQVQSPADLNTFIRDLTVKIKIASTAHVRRTVAAPAVAPAAVSAAPAAAVPAGVAAAVSAATAAIPSVPTAPLTPPATKAPPAAPARPAKPVVLRSSPSNTLIAIGASTGGTEAILEVVKDLPANTPGILVVQHMPPVFTRMYAERLNRICKMRVKEAENGDRVETGKIIIAAGDFQLRLNKDSNGYYVVSEPGARVNGHCPSVEVMFNTVAAVAGSRAVGVILTGMGADGARGLLAMRQAGAYTIGQDKDSCVVYGMPMVAFNIGGVAKQLPLGQIGSEILRYISTM